MLPISDVLPLPILPTAEIMMVLVMNHDMLPHRSRAIGQGPSRDFWEFHLTQGNGLTMPTSQGQFLSKCSDIEHGRFQEVSLSGLSVVQASAEGLEILSLSAVMTLLSRPPS